MTCADDREHLEDREEICEYCIRFGMDFAGDRYDANQCECTEHPEDMYED